MFCDAALYDTQTKSRISENFYFNINSQDVLENYNLTSVFDPIDKMAKKAIFTINNASSKTIYIVFRIRKILEGDIIKVSERYAQEKVNAQDKKSVARKAKDVELIKDICKRLSTYKQPLAYAALLLQDSEAEVPKETNLKGKVDESNPKLNQNKTNLDQTIISENEENDKTNTTDATPTEKTTTNNNINEATVDQNQKQDNKKKGDEKNSSKNGEAKEYIINSFIRASESKISEEDICTLICSDKSKKMKTIQGLKLTINIKKINDNDEIMDKVDPSLVPVKPVSSGEETKEIVQEIQEFSTNQMQLTAVYSSYINNLYVYPQLLNLNKSKLKGRNIACKIMMLDGTPHSDSAIPLEV